MKPVRRGREAPTPTRVATNNSCDQEPPPVDVIRTVSASLQACLNEDLDQLARDCELVIRERVFTGRTLLLVIVATLLRKPDATWADFHLTAAQLGLRLS